MKKILCLFITVILVLVCTGCSSGMDTIEDTKENNSSMFVIVEGGVDTYYQIVYHKDTRVMYAVSRGGYNQGTFTLMVDAEGKPLLWESK